MKKSKEIKNKITKGGLHKSSQNIQGNSKENKENDYMFTIREEEYESSQYQFSNRQSNTLQDFSTIKYRSSLREEQSKLIQSLSKSKEWKISQDVLTSVTCFDEDEEEIGEQSIVEVTEEQGTLILPKKIIDSCSNKIYDPKVTGFKRKINILYECSDLQFEKILQILSQEGIKLVSQESPTKVRVKEERSRRMKGIITTLK